MSIRKKTIFFAQMTPGHFVVRDESTRNDHLA